MKSARFHSCLRRIDRGGADQACRPKDAMLAVRACASKVVAMRLARDRKAVARKIQAQDTATLPRRRFIGALAGESYGLRLLG